MSHQEYDKDIMLTSIMKWKQFIAVEGKKKVWSIGIWLVVSPIV